MKDAKSVKSMVCLLFALSLTHGRTVKLQLLLSTVLLLLIVYTDQQSWLLVSLEQQIYYFLIDIYVSFHLST